LTITDDFPGVFASKQTYHPCCSTILINVSGRGVEQGEEKVMWDTVTDRRHAHLSHEMPCQSCGHPAHTYLPCSDVCDCTPPSVPGAVSGRNVDLVLR
jgi:hypothetical protein